MQTRPRVGAPRDCASPAVALQAHVNLAVAYPMSTAVDDSAAAQRPPPDELRPVRITRRYTNHAEGSVLVEFGDTR